MTPPVRPPAANTVPTLAQAFEAFLGERRYAYAAPDMDRILRRFQDLLAGPEGAAWPLTEIHRLDELVLASQGDKARAAQVVLDFHDYAASRYGLDARSALEGVHFVDDPTERQIEILKYLHQPRGTQEICEHFSLEPRTIRKDLRQLAEGTRFLGVDLSADFSGRDHRYRSSQHPVFLVLSLSEAYAMTVGLLKLAPAGSDQHAFYLGMAARVWRQLSNYARDRLRERAPEECALLDDQPADSAPEWQAHRHSRANELMYLFKSGEPATVSLLRAGGEEVYEGARLHWKGGSVYTLRPAGGEPFDIDQAEILALEDFDYR